MISSPSKLSITSVLLNVKVEIYSNRNHSTSLSGIVACEHRVRNDHSAINNKNYSTKISTVIFKHTFGDSYISTIYTIVSVLVPPLPTTASMFVTIQFKIDIQYPQSFQSLLHQMLHALLFMIISSLLV